MKNPSIFVGDEGTTLDGYPYTVVKYVSALEISIQFDCGEIQVHKAKRLRIGINKDGSNVSVPIKERLTQILNCAQRRVRANETYTQSYIGCSVSSEWLTDKNNFSSWALRQYGCEKVDWELDKDILVKGNKVYGPDTCCFVPREINIALSQNKSKRGNLPVGVKRSNTTSVRFTAQLGGRLHLGTFETPEKAFLAYKLAKESHIKSLAFKYKNELDPKVFNALMCYEIEITD